LVRVLQKGSVERVLEANEALGALEPVQRRVQVLAVRRIPDTGGQLVGVAGQLPEVTLVEQAPPGDVVVGRVDVGAGGRE